MASDLPIVWLGQSVDTSSICSGYSSLRTAPFLTSLGCAIRRPSLKTSHFVEGLKAKLGIKGPLMVDSGGFALGMNPKEKWTVHPVAEAVERINAEVFVSLDYPPSAKDGRRERRVKIVNSMANYQFLSSSFPNKCIMPVVHGRSIEEIQLSIRLLKDIDRTPRWIGLGGIVPLLQGRSGSAEIAGIGIELFIAYALQEIRRAFPKSIIHAFGAGGTRIFPILFGLGADSADSIGWRQAAGFGSIFLPLKSQRVVKWDREKRAPRKILDASDRDDLRSCKCPICSQCKSLRSKLACLRSSFHNRSIHNAWTIVHQKEKWPDSRSGVLALVKTGVLGAKWAGAASLIPGV